MKYFIDTEFLEGKQQIRIPLTNISIGETNPTIDLISIGIVSEDNREYYAISKEFNLKEAWNRFEMKESHFSNNGQFMFKDYWIRNNVLKPIYNDLIKRWLSDVDSLTENKYVYFNYSNLKKLINKYGKTNKEIAEEVEWFIRKGNHVNCNNDKLQNDATKEDVKFYGYYADYDWVVFCWLFGNMNELPTGFPMYCNDLIQMQKELETNSKLNSIYTVDMNVLEDFDTKKFIQIMQKSGYLLAKSDTQRSYTDLRKHPAYPKQTNEHNALNDARWNKELYKFLKSITK